MKLIFIYGPPASGKLTIAEELSKLTGISLFHNHLTRDLVQDIYGDELEANYDLVDKLRIDVFEYCAQKGKDLIFTYVYGGLGGDEETIIKDQVDAVESHGGKVEFVELVANEEELLRRVGNESRSKHKKLLDPNVLQKFLNAERQQSISFSNAYRIDTSFTPPKESAKLIATKIGLKFS